MRLKEITLEANIDNQFKDQALGHSQSIEGRGMRMNQQKTVVAAGAEPREEF